MSPETTHIASNSNETSQYRSETVKKAVSGRSDQVRKQYTPPSVEGKSIKYRLDTVQKNSLYRVYLGIIGAAVLIIAGITTVALLPRHQHRTQAAISNNPTHTCPTEVNDRSVVGVLTPLEEAAFYGNMDLVRLLLNCGVDVNAGNPVYEAVSARHVDVVQAWRSRITYCRKFALTIPLSYMGYFCLIILSLFGVYFLSFTYISCSLIIVVSRLRS